VSASAWQVREGSRRVLPLRGRLRGTHPTRRCALTVRVRIRPCTSWPIHVGHPARSHRRNHAAPWRTAAL